MYVDAGGTPGFVYTSILPGPGNDPGKSRQGRPYRFLWNKTPLKPKGFIGFWPVGVTKPYKFKCSGDINSLTVYKFIGLRWERACLSSCFRACLASLGKEKKRRDDTRMERGETQSRDYIRREDNRREDRSREGESGHTRRKSSISGTYSSHQNPLLGRPPPQSPCSPLGGSLPCPRPPDLGAAALQTRVEGR